MNPRTLYPLTVWMFWCVGVPLVLIAVGFAAVVATSAEALMFDNAHLWWLGAAGPVAGVLILYGVLRRRAALMRFTSPQLAPLLVCGIRPGRQAMRGGLLTAAALLIAAGILGPRWGVYLEEQKVRGIDIVVALDVSRSMLAEDVRPNRLERAKGEIRQQLLERAVFQEAGRLALLAFAGSASLKVPLSTDHLTFRRHLERVGVGSAPRGGTAIGEAIRAASDLLMRSPREATRVIVVLTDGEDHEGGAVDAAKEALEEHGIRTYTVAAGDPERTVGARIPIRDGATVRPLLYDGQIVFSRVNVDALRAIADAGGGRMATIEAFPQLVGSLAGLHRTHLTTEERLRHKPRYQWFAAAAMFLLVLEATISDRRKAVKNLSQRGWQRMAA